jgi:hypothetical protein
MPLRNAQNRNLLQRKLRDPSEGYVEPCQEIQDSALPEPQSEQRAEPLAYVEVPV